MSIVTLAQDSLLQILSRKASETAATNEFVGNYHDPNHPGCVRTIKALSATEVAVTGFDGATGGACNGKNDEPWGPLDGKVTGDTIVIDFRPKGGPPDLTGTWTPASKRITWADGNYWPMY